MDTKQVTGRIGSGIACVSLALALQLGTAHAAPPAHQTSAGAHGLNGSIVVSGTMSSGVTLTMKGAFSVGQASDLDWKIPLPQTMQTSGYTESVKSVNFQFNVPPTSYSDVVDNSGRPQRDFYWSQPPANTVITVTETLKLNMQTDLKPFHSTAAFPVAGVPSTIQSSYLQPVTSMIQLPGSAQVQSLLHKFTAGTTSEFEVVNRVTNWVATNVRYNANRVNGPYDAASVLRDRQTVCRGFVNLAIGFLRQLKIPAQAVDGWVSATPFSLKGDGASATFQWATAGTQGEAHTWMNVYFPGSGWVAFDPQREKFFVDTRHLALYTNVDAGDPHVGTWNASVAAGESATGFPLANGIAEILPGDGTVNGQVTVTTRDSFHLKLGTIRHDVTGMLLLTR